MKYDKIEKTTFKRNLEREELETLAKLYVRSESISEFTLKATTAGLDKFGFIKWFKLFYFLMNNSMYDSFGWYVIGPGFALTTFCTWLAISLLSTDALGVVWKSLTVVILAVVGVAATIATTRYMGEKLSAVKSTVWKMD